MAKKTPLLKEFYKGIIPENPVFRLMLGTCPTLAVTTAAMNGLAMGAASTFVLLGSNIVISLLRNIIPSKVRIAAYIVIIAGFVSIVQLFIKAYSPDLDASLGLYLPLIVVNCIILGRAEAFASKNNVGRSVLDAIGMGIGFTLALVCIGLIREFIGAGTLFGFTLTTELWAPMIILILPPGGFFVYGVLVMIVNVITKKRLGEPRDSLDCASCPVAACAVKEEDKRRKAEAEARAKAKEEAEAQKAEIPATAQAQAQTSTEEAKTETNTDTATSNKASDTDASYKEGGLS